MKDAIRGLFNGSVPQLVSSFVNSREISLHELEELKEMVEKEIKNKQQ
jgi:predicted transcriptional regulator